MKKYISYIFVSFIFFFIFYGKINAVVTLKIDANGNINASGDNLIEYEEYWDFDGENLSINKADDPNDRDDYFKIDAEKDINLILSDKVYIERIDTNSNLTITSQNDNDIPSIGGIWGGKYSDYIRFEDIKIRIGICTWFYKYDIDNSILYPKNDDEGIIFDIHLAPAPTNNDYEKDKYSFDIKDSTIYSETAAARNGFFNVVDSKIIIPNSYNRELIILNSTIDMKNSTLECVDNCNVSINNTNIDTNFEDSKLDVDYMVNNGTKLTKEDHFKNCTINANTFNGFDAIMDNTTINTEIYSDGSLIANDSSINISPGDNNYINSMSFYYIELNNSSLVNSGNGSFYTTDMTKKDYGIKLINSTMELGKKSTSGWLGTYGIYLDNSELKANLDNVYINVNNEYLNDNRTDPNKNGVFISKNSKSELGNVTFYNDFVLENSESKINSLTGISRNENGLQVGADLKMNNSKLYVDSENENGIVINDLFFNNSYLLSKANENAWKSKIDITTHNLSGINEEKNIMPLKSNMDNEMYSFYENDEISKYVEIRTPLKVTFKIKNGTWKDGSTEDKIIETYFFGSINEVDVPKEMIASDGYENGSWDKQIVYDELKDEYVYTYEFKPKGVEPEKKESPKKEEKKEEKKLKNPDTGAFISLITIGILIVICIKVLRYTRRKKLLNRL